MRPRVALPILTTVLTGCFGGYSDPKGAELAGTDAQVSQIEVVDLKLAALEEGEPARLLGTLMNQGEAPREMTFRDDDDVAAVVVPAESVIDLLDMLTAFDPADVQPGTIMTGLVMMDSDEKAVELPIVNGTVEEYGNLVPNEAER